MTKGVVETTRPVNHRRERLATYWHSHQSGRPSHPSTTQERNPLTCVGDTGLQVLVAHSGPSRGTPNPAPPMSHTGRLPTRPNMLDVFTITK